MSRLLTINHTAELLALSPHTIRRLIKRGTLRAVRVGARSIRVPETSLHAVIREAEKTNRASIDAPEDSHHRSGVVTATFQTA
jgi:excisionase family DNA binding protein